MKILFAPIGNPRNYDEVTYTIDGKNTHIKLVLRQLKKHLI